MKNIKSFEEHKLVKLSDVISSGNLSADYHLKKDKNQSPYFKKDGKFVKVEPKKSIPKNAVYLTDEQAEKYNKIEQEIKKLQVEQEKIIN